MDLDELREELKEYGATKKVAACSPREERIIAGFEEIQKFFEDKGRAPRHGESHDIFERLYAVRLDRIRGLEECRSLLEPIDHQGLLSQSDGATTDDDSVDDDELRAALDGVAGSSEITELRHVRNSADKRAAEEIANRQKCEDFEDFRELFEAARADLKSGLRKSRSFQERSMDEIQEGTFFIVGGQIAYVASVGEAFLTKYERRDSRLRVIYDNGTESEVLQRSLQRALHRDEAARLISDPDAGPLFSDTWEDGDTESGTIYVLRSKSDHPYVAEHRKLIHKIGVTGGKVETRIANAKKDATYLLADVEIVSTYKLSGINRKSLENLLHRFFSPAQLDLTIQDRFGNEVKPREWFLVPLHVIDEAVDRIRNGSIKDVIYNPKEASITSP